MKVILLRDVAKMGRKGQICEVPSGHAANFLIPRKLAVAATAENLKRHTAETKHYAEGEAKTQDAFRAVIATLEKSPVSYAAAANEQGHLFKGIRAADVAKCLKEAGMVVDVHAIVLPQPIKELGTHTITLKQGGIEGVCTLEVVKQ